MVECKLRVISRGMICWREKSRDRKSFFAFHSVGSDGTDTFSVGAMIVKKVSDTVVFYRKHFQFMTVDGKLEA